MSDPLNIRAFTCYINSIMSELNKHQQLFESTEQTSLTTEMLAAVRNSLYHQGCKLDTCLFEFNIHEDSYSRFQFQFHRYESRRHQDRLTIIEEGSSRHTYIKLLLASISLVYDLLHRLAQYGMTCDSQMYYELHSNTRYYAEYVNTWLQIMATLLVYNANVISYFKSTQFPPEDISKIHEIYTRLVEIGILFSIGNPECFLELGKIHTDMVVLKCSQLLDNGIQLAIPEYGKYRYHFCEYTILDQLVCIPSDYISAHYKFLMYMRIIWAYMSANNQIISTFHAIHRPKYNQYWYLINREYKQLWSMNY